jgi:tRNA pseudouridine13 synthase
VPNSGLPISSSQRELLAQGADLDSLPRALNPPATSGIIRRAPVDFIVSEILPFPLSGSGEHQYLKIRKTGHNTRWVARQLAKNYHLPYRSVSFAGLKDRHAITEQWFSIHLAGKPDLDLAGTRIDGVEIIESSRHTRKLKRGMLRGNRFRIAMQNLSGDLDKLQARLLKLKSTTIPNYFGAQRFGKNAGNLDLLNKSGSVPISDRDTRSFGLSALRSALFNSYLAERIDAGTWHQSLPGEIVYDACEQIYRHVDALTDDDKSKYRSTGLLWGCGENQSTGPALDTETEFFDRFSEVTALLSAYEVRMVRRPLSMSVTDLDWEICDDRLEVGFTLRRGMYATVVLREIADVTEGHAV